MRAQVFRLLDECKADGAPPDGQQNPDLTDANDRPAKARDHLWLEWNERDSLTPGKIRDKWNQLDEQRRIKLSPKRPNKIARGEGGIDTVKKALNKAKEENKSENSPVSPV